MRRAGGLSPGPEKQSSLRMHPRDLHHPQAAGSHRPSPPPRLGIQSCWPPPARARHVVFEDELMPLGRPSRRVPTDKESKKSVPPTLAPRPCTLPDYVVRYPAIRSPRQREGYKGVFQDQLAEYTELLGQVRATWHGLGAQEGKTKVAHVWQEHGRKKRVSRGRAQDGFSVLGSLWGGWGGKPTASPPQRRGSAQLSAVQPAGCDPPGAAAALPVPEAEADAHQGSDPRVRPRRRRRHRAPGQEDPRTSTPGAWCWEWAGGAVRIHPAPCLCPASAQQANCTHQGMEEEATHRLVVDKVG
ncbi:occludin/ELL domain-containing protein 1 isoform X2 [Pogoniulus pusillus]|uniref:occludin/ELL domain-containing protein 1 isoform X2 n=1 Tax=Pogoniulus pusillus TaxID=488313 RepID=UPI0030B96484